MLRCHKQHRQRRPAVPATGSSPVALTLADALSRAKANSPQFQAALTQFGLAKEDRVQARAALLPNVQYTNSFIYTQGNGATGIYIANNGVHEYISQGIAHEALGFGSFADYKRTVALQAFAKAKAEVAARGLVVTVVQLFYGLLTAQEKTLNVQRATDEAQHFLDFSKKLEVGGEVAHSDVVKAQIQANDAARQLQDTKLAEQNARLSLAVLLFPNFFQDFTLVNDLASAPQLPDRQLCRAVGQEQQSRAARRIRGAHCRRQGIDGCQGGTSADADRRHVLRHRCQPVCHRRSQRTAQSGLRRRGNVEYPNLQLGSHAEQGSKQAELQRRQAQVELSAAQRQALADFQSFYAEAQTAVGQIDTLRNSAESRR